MTAIQPDMIERPHRFALSKIPPLQAIVRRIAAEPLSSGNNAPEIAPEFFADLLDFSGKGIKLSLPFQASFQERLSIRLELEEVDYCYESVAVVRHIRMDDGRWVAGCSIEPHLPDFLVDYLAHTIGKDRRRHSRCQLSGLGYFKREGDTHGTPAEFLNLSESGFSAKITHFPLLGERVKFLIYDKARNLKQVTARIRWTRKVDGEDAYFVGSSFIEKADYKLFRSAFLVQYPDNPIILKRDNIGWYVIAACLLCMLIPPLTSIAYESAVHRKTQHETETIDKNVSSKLTAAEQTQRPSPEPIYSDSEPKYVKPEPISPEPKTEGALVISELPFEEEKSEKHVNSLPPNKRVPRPFLIADEPLAQKPKRDLRPIPSEELDEVVSSRRERVLQPSDPDYRQTTTSSRRVE